MLKRNDAGTFTGLINVIAKMQLCARKIDREGIGRLANELCREYLQPRGRFIGAHVRPDGTIAARIEHNPIKHKPAENPRIFDALFFAAFLLIERCGVTTCFHVRDKEVDGKDRYYLRLRPSQRDRKSVPQPYVARVVCDALSDRDARQEGDHHSYLYRDLMQLASKGRLPSGKNGRAEAIEESRKGFERKYPNGLEGVTADQIAAVLARLLETATEYHSKEEA